MTVRTEISSETVLPAAYRVPPSIFTRDTAPLPSRSTVDGAVVLAMRAPSVRHERPWRWHLASGALHLLINRPLHGIAALDHEVLLSCGAALGHLRVALAAFGWATTVHRVPSERSGQVARLEIRPSTPCDEDIAAAAALNRHQDPAPPGRTISHRQVSTLRERADAAGAELIPAAPPSQPVDGHHRPTGEIPAIPLPRIPDYDQPPGPPRWFRLLTATGGHRASLRAGEILSTVTVAASRLGLVCTPLSLTPAAGSTDGIGPLLVQLR
ncbi:hypothetical protein [Haloechinothrix sp. LS1_15]|uniref:hypothetical protein n=1 Tax=Haloechinothrix sp. LS1_15 TaxID=2652248 RepID=UPI00294861E8|nr:hypothetical protein [Haloechinothrix sp. LS1_15]MDV6014270.1 hypothetical protein [Haloechinothrix sp. LS1_15]